MFTVSWYDLAGPTMTIVLACAAIMFPVDRANWPIPEAYRTWW